MERAIGVIDSGVGGLTVMYELMRQLPKEELIYVGDTLRCPYGSRPESEVKQYTKEMIQFLMTKDIKMIVIACNTATAFALEELKESLPIPIIGVIQPGARAAIKQTKNKKVGVIGTEGTIRSEAYTEALHQINKELEITGLACPLFVPMVEKGILTGDRAEQVVEEALQPLKSAKQIDTLVLGCTHYPLLEPTIQRMMGADVNIISSSEETARETSTLLEMNELLYQGNRKPVHYFYTTGELELFEKIAHLIFNEHVTDMEHVHIEKIVLQ